MATVSVVSRVSIDAKPEAVFKYLSQPSYHFLWNPALRSLTPATRLKLGSQYKTTSLLLGVKINAVNQVTAFVPNQAIELENNTGLLKYRIDYRLRRTSKCTQLVCTIEVSADSQAFAFSKPILKLLARRELQSDLNALKLAVENQLG